MGVLLLCACTDTTILPEETHHDDTSLVTESPTEIPIEAPTEGETQTPEAAVFKEFGLGSLRFTFGGGFGRYFGGGLGYQRCAIVMCLLRKDCSIGTCA